MLNKTTRSCSSGKSAICRKNIFLLLIILFTSVSYSQVEIKMNELPKGTLNGSDLWKFTAKNTGSDNLNTVFQLDVILNDTLLYESSTKTTAMIPGESISMDLKFEQPPLKNWRSNILKRIITREMDFVPGDYKICMTAKGVNAKDQIDDSKIYGTQCFDHNVVNYENDATMEIKPKKPENGKLLTSDLWNFTMKNTSKAKLDVEILCKVTFDGKDLFEGLSRAFIIKAGDTQDLNLVYTQAIKNTWKIEPMRNDIEKTGIFPPGDYTLCLTVRSEWSGKEYGSNCIDVKVEAEKNDNK